MESLVDKFAASYRDIVAATLTEDGVSEEQKAILLTKFVSLFTDKLRLVKHSIFGFVLQEINSGWVWLPLLERN